MFEMWDAGRGVSLFDFYMQLSKPKKISVGIIGGVVALLIIAGIFGDAPEPKSQEAQQPAEQTGKDIINVQSNEKAATEAIKIYDGTVLVTRAIDGDTIELENGQRVRYIGIDTPETVDPRKPVQCFGVEASNRNKQLVENKRVRLEKDISETDKYGRLLRYIYVGDTFVNLVLVQDGFAYSSTYPPDVKYQNQFIDAQKGASEQKKGLWGSCPTTTETPALAPAPTPTPASTPAPSPTPTTSCIIKGNISSSGEKIYHVEGCGSYSQTKIDEARGEKWFCTETEAVAAGWRKALNCP